MDFGYGLEKELSTRLAKLQIVVSVALTVLIWIVAFLVR